MYHQPYFMTEPDPAWVDDTRRRTRHVLTRVGLALVLALAVSQGVGFVLSFWLMEIAPDAFSNAWVLLGISMLPLYLLGIPLALLVLRPLPTAVCHQPAPLSGRQWLRLFLIGYALLYLANILSTLAISALGALRGSPIINPSQLLSDLPILPSFFYMALLAPILEEWLFRGVILRRLLPHGERFAIVVSALLFGLFHGNFFQMLFAFAIGLVLGYTTVRTGLLRYAVVMHILINFFNGVVLPAVLLRAGDGAIVLSGLVVLAMVIAGVVLLVRHRRQAYLYPAPPPLPDRQRLGQFFRSPGMICFVLACLGLALYQAVLL